MSFPGKTEAGQTASNPFDEQLQFFRDKLSLPTKRYDDILRSAHDRAFVVAGAANADLLSDLNAAIRRSIEDGKGLAAFRKDFDAIVRKHGWTGWTGEGSEAGQAWRTRVIYQTNMATSYAAGRWKQLKDPALLSIRPFWRYVHSDSVMHPRPIHLSWDGMVLPHDHPFWDTHFPPNGWGCQCTVEAAGAKEYASAQSEGKSEPPADWDQPDPKTGGPIGIDKGWDYAPGAKASRPLQEFIDQKLIKLDGPVGAAMYESMRPVLRAERNAAYAQFLDEVLADPVKRGRYAIVGAIDPATMRWLKESLGLIPASAEIAIQDGLLIGKKAIRHALAGDAFSAEEWAALPAKLEAPERIVYDTRTGKLLYIVGSQDSRAGKLAVEFDFRIKRQDGVMNMIVSGFKVAAEVIAADIKGGILMVVR
ncbi:hypothetical protein ACZ75_10805 [Massilia sp. NR 4-1]|nr:hypothetical protein ACZ75_10805 [Massilia sp. NR 4-1]